jgi:hypothetical protein
MRTYALLLLALLACSCSAGGEGGPKIALRYHPPAGAVYHYDLDQTTKVSMAGGGPLAGLGDQQLTMRMHFTQRVHGPPSGGGEGTELEVVFDSTSMDVPGMTAASMAEQMHRLRGLRSTVVLDDRARVVRSDYGSAPGVSPAVTQQMAAGIKAMTFEFPEQPVGRGDSWSLAAELPLGELPGVDATKAGAARTIITVRDVRANGSDTSVVLEMKTAFPTGPIQLDVGGQKGTLQLAGELGGNQEFSLNRGTVLNGSMKGAMTMNITANLFGTVTMKMTSNTESTIHLVDEK